MEEDNIYYVYCLINPIDNKIFYIGHGHGRRIHQHWYSFSRYGHKGCDGNRYKYDVLKDILKANLVPIEKKICTKLSIKAAIKFEACLIRKYGRLCNKTGFLTNIREDELHSPMSIPEIAKKCSESKKRLFQTDYGKELARQQSIRETGKKRSAKTKAKNIRLK